MTRNPRPLVLKHTQFINFEKSAELVRNLTQYISSANWPTTLAALAYQGLPVRGFQLRLGGFSVDSLHSFAAANISNLFSSAHHSMPLNALHFTVTSTQRLTAHAYVLSSAQLSNDAEWPCMSRVTGMSFHLDRQIHVEKRANIGNWTGLNQCICAFARSNLGEDTADLPQSRHMGDLEKPVMSFSTRNYSSATLFKNYGLKKKKLVQRI